MEINTDAKDLCLPFRTVCTHVLQYTVCWFCAPWDAVSRQCVNAEQTICLWFSACCCLIVPLLFAYWATVALVLAVELLAMALIGCIWGFALAAIGIWPAFAYSFVFAFIAVVRIPCNIYYHARVTFRTVCLKNGLKFMSLLFIPFVHLLIPIILTVCVTMLSFIFCFSFSFFHSPMIPWKALRPVSELFWKLYVTNIMRLVANFGHASGVPENWDGKVYGLPIDPITWFVGLFLLTYGVVVVTLMNCILLLAKAIPMYLGIVHSFSDRACICTAWNVYAQVLMEYAKLDICPLYSKYAYGYYKLCPTRMIPSDPCACILMSWLIALATLWWCIIWPFVLLVPVFSYILYWLVIILGPPIAYIISWIACTTIGPFVCLILAIAAGPFLALRVPYVALRHNLLLRGQVRQSMKFGLREPFVILKDLDRITGGNYVGNCTFLAGEATPDPAPAWKKDVQSRVYVKYWDLFIARCMQEANEAAFKKWLATDEIAAASSNVLVAVPGLAMLGVLVESVRHEGDRTLIRWDENTKCDANTRDLTDSIGNHYWPLLMKTKTNLRRFVRDGSELQQEAWYIGAKLCSGEAEHSAELVAALQQYSFPEAKTIQLNRCCAEISDIVLSLLRTQEMKKRFPAVCASVGSASSATVLGRASI